MSSQPWSVGAPLAPDVYQALVRRAMFECCKWHTHVDDQPILCRVPLLLEPTVSRKVARLAEALAGEALAAEQELLERPELHGDLGLPLELQNALAEPGRRPTPGAARVMRFDFHWTRSGWRISEGNIDAAGGFIESSGVTRLMAEHYAEAGPAGDPAGAWADAVVRAVGPGGRVGLVHVTIYTEDRQMMLYFAARLEERGVTSCPLSPSQVRWQGGRAQAGTDAAPLDLLFRFLPAEWLPRISHDTGWQTYLTGSQTPICNPAYAVLTQSKRFALVWDRLATPLSTWHALLPQTCSPCQLDGAVDDWVLKPALGHEGMDIGIAGATNAEDLERIRRSAREHAGLWAAQRRFDAVPLSTPDGPVYPCLGVYVIDGQAAGAYGRVSSRPLIDDMSREIVVLIRKGG